MMKQVKSKYHALHVLKRAEPNLRRRMNSNCNKELVKSMSECILNVLNGNVKLLGITLVNCVSTKPHSARWPNNECLSYQVEAHSSTGWISDTSAENSSAHDRKSIISPQKMLRIMFLVSAEKFPPAPK